jgi:hypothetical protein
MTLHERQEPACAHMLLILGGLVTLAAVMILPRLRLPGGVDAHDLGWMSEQWLAEYRASRVT